MRFFKTSNAYIHARGCNSHINGKKEKKTKNDAADWLINQIIILDCIDTIDLKKKTNYNLIMKLNIFKYI
jgi:hypothetical protein